VGMAVRGLQREARRGKDCVQGVTSGEGNERETSSIGEEEGNLAPARKRAKREERSGENLETDPGQREYEWPKEIIPGGRRT
jgi:hypothetical protein